MSTVSIAPPLSLEFPPLNREQRTIAWAVALSLLVHGVALGWLPGLEQAHSLVPQPLRVLLPSLPVPTAVPPAPTFRPEVVPQPLREPVRRESAPMLNPVLSRATPEPTPSAPTVAPRPEPLIVPMTPTTPTAAAPAAPQVAAPETVLRPTAPDPAALAAYGRDLAGAVAQHQRYPRVAELRQWQGTTLLQLELAADGRLLGVRVLSSSGHDILDQQAIAMARAATPLPPLPSSLAGRSLTIDVPVVFRLA